MSTRPQPPVGDLLGSGSPCRLAPDAPQIVLHPPGSLRTNPRNARTHAKRQIRQLANSIKAAGFIGAIIIDEDDMILAGHGRRDAAILLGMDRVPTIKVIGLSDAQKRVFALADNKLSENAGWDREILALELGELAELLPALNWNLTVTGFEAAEIDTLFADRGPAKPDPADTLPRLEHRPVTRRGDQWRFGQHHLRCGDARSASDLDRLMAGARARMVFTDPPYNVRIADVQGRGRVKHPEFAHASGEMSEPQYIAFLEESLGNAARLSTDGAVHYVCIDWRHIAELIAAGRTVYGAMLNMCVWCKTNAGQGTYYRSQHELIGVFRVGDASHQNNIQLGQFGRNRSNVWTYAGVNAFGAGRMDMLAMHPTVKPVALIADALRDCTTKGDIVLDPFVGSGTTMLAAEKIGRRAYALECEPKYVDVAIQRWQAYTKSEAMLESDGRTYAEVRAERLKSPSDLDSQTAVSNNAAKDAGTGASADAPPESDWVALCKEVAVTPAAQRDQ
jgi:DNA modification methylase